MVTAGPTVDAVPLPTVTPVVVVDIVPGVNAFCFALNVMWSAADNNPGCNDVAVLMFTVAPVDPINDPAPPTMTSPDVVVVRSCGVFGRARALNRSQSAFDNNPVLPESANVMFMVTPDPMTAPVPPNIVTPEVIVDILPLVTVGSFPFNVDTRPLIFSMSMAANT